MIPTTTKMEKDCGTKFHNGRISKYRWNYINGIHKKIPP
jgi:hypothetical protein